MDWSSASTWVSVMGALALPPVSLLLFGLVGLAMLSRKPNTGWSLLVLSLLLSWLLGTPALGNLLSRANGEVKPFDPATYSYLKPQERPQVIVVLANGWVTGAEEWKAGEGVLRAGATPLEGADSQHVMDLSPRALARVRYAAWLQHALGLPVLMSGGGKKNVDAVHAQPTEAELMKSVLEREFGVPVKFVEIKSNNTYESAQEVAHMLAPVGMQRVLLVTHHWHMARAKFAFKHAGLEVVAAPMGFQSVDLTNPLSWVPSTEGMSASRLALREMVGRVTYHVRAALFH
jgi:uncharacterized SAM-binding protein YcdF (DUF218 family)